MTITTVKLQDNGYLVDGSKSVPQAPGNADYEAVELWKLGKTEAWLQLELTFNKETAAHDNWLKIQSYDADIIAYNIAFTAWDSWVFNVNDPVRPDMPVFVPVPKGYYTQTEVDNSTTEYNDWEIGHDAWVADTDPTKPTAYWIDAPDVYTLPAGVVEPIVTALPALVPNTPDDQYTLDEYKDLKRTELKRDCNIDIESGYTSNAMGMNYTYESELKDQLNISGAAQANTTVEFTVIDAIGNKLRVSHSASQMSQVFFDGVAVMQAKKNSLYILLGTVNSASNQAAVDAITWS